MPVVRRVQTAPLPGVRRSPQRIAQIDAPLLKVQPPAEAFGAQLGETVAKVGEHFLAQHMDERAKATARANEVNVNNAMTGTMTDAQNVIAAALQTQGMEAAGVPEQALGEIDKGSDERRMKLVNDDQRFLYDREFQARRVQYHGRLMEHAAVQVAKADDDSTQAKLGAIKNDALLNAKDPNTVESNIAQGEAEIDKSAAARLGPVSTKAAKEAYRSSIQRGAIQMLLSQGNDRDAAKRFTEVQGQLNAADLKATQDALEIGSTLGESQRFAKQIWTDNKGKPLSVLEAEAEKHPNVKIQDEAKDRLRQYNTIYEKEQMEAERALTAQAKAAADAKKAQWDQYTTNVENKIDAGLPADAVRKLPGWADAPDDVRKSVLSYAKTIAEKPEGIKTKEEILYGLYWQASHNPAKFIGRNLYAETLNDLSPSDFEKITALQYNLTHEDKKDSGQVLDNFRSHERVINTVLTNAGLDPTPQEGTPQAKAIGNLWQAVEQEVTKLEEGPPKKKAGNADIERITKELLYPVGGQPSSWLGWIQGTAPFWSVPAKRVFELPPPKPPQGPPLPPPEPTAVDDKGNTVVFRGGKWVKP